MSEKTYTQQEVSELVESMRDMITANTQDASIRQRMASVLSGGYDWADTLHNIYLDFGYPATLSFFNFWNMYRRFGIATRVVELYPDQTWLDEPIVEGSEKFNGELERLVEKLGLWRRLKGLDTRQRVGRYGGLFMRVRDNKNPKEPIAGKLGGLAALVDMIPLYEGQLKVSTTQDDVKADDYGMPTMYEFNSGSAGNRNERANSSFNIHPSRVVIASEDSDNSNIYGVSCLEPVYNSLMDLRKIIGGGGEGFYKNAAQSIVFDLKDAASAKANKALLDKFNEQYDEFAQNRSRRAMWTPGMEAKTLDSRLTNPKEFFMNALYDVSAGANVPASVLIGNQTGRLAGDQDTRGFLSQVQARRLDFGTDIVRAAVDWLIRFGILPASEYSVEWPDALAPSSDEKLANADKMADINQKVFLSGGTVPFTGEEIREEAGFELEEGEELPPDENDIGPDAE
jgi:hypothetical protein